jgi:hypothetical protein
MMRSKFSFITCVYLFVGTIQIHAQAIIADSVDERIFTLNELAFFVDEDKIYTIDSVLHSTNKVLFVKQPNYQNSDFKTNTPYWVKFTIQLKEHTNKKWLLEFYDQSIDQLEVWIPNTQGKYTYIKTGDATDFNNRVWLHKNFEIPIDSWKDTTITCYFKIQSHEFADIRVAFRSVNRFVYYALNEYMLYGMFYGMVLIIVLYNFLVYLAIREIKNIYYIGYILSVALYAASLDGTGFQYLWPAFPSFNTYAVGVFLFLLILFALLFTRKFLNTKATAPLLDKWLLIMIVVRSSAFLLLLIFYPSALPYRNADVIPLSIIFFTGIQVWRNGYKPARFFVIAYGILFLGFFLRMLVYFNFLPFTILSHYSLHISFGVEMLFLTFALGDRIRILKDNRDKALRRVIVQHEDNMQLKDKVNRELEEKVKERTLALHQKNEELARINEKLERQSFEINQINSLLDLDNWKLKNSIKEVLESRLKERVMEYDQFHTLYPDELSCYRLIEELKWEKGFTCRQCNNDKYFSGSQKFARRCTKCGYNESITAYTIFHHLKFPIEKAFYIAYVAVAKPDAYTLEALSTRLNLRLNTVWTFKNKVMERIEWLKKHGKRASAETWQTVLLLPEDVKLSK